MEEEIAQTKVSTRQRAMETVGEFYERELYEYCDTGLGQQAMAFDAANPHVWDLFVTFSKTARNSGKHGYGASMVFNRLRWEVDFEYDDEACFKLNNNYIAYYSRKIMAKNSDFWGFYSLRDFGGQAGGQQLVA